MVNRLRNVSGSEINEGRIFGSSVINRLPDSFCMKFINVVAIGSVASAVEPNNNASTEEGNERGISSGRNKVAAVSSI